MPLDLSTRTTDRGLLTGGTRSTVDAEKTVDEAKSVIDPSKSTAGVQQTSDLALPSKSVDSERLFMPAEFEKAVASTAPLFSTAKYSSPVDPTRMTSEAVKKITDLVAGKNVDFVSTSAQSGEAAKMFGTSTVSSTKTGISDEKAITDRDKAATDASKALDFDKDEAAMKEAISDSKATLDFLPVLKQRRQQKAAAVIEDHGDSIEILYEEDTPLPPTALVPSSRFPWLLLGVGALVVYLATRK